jgi:hypothetical protein
MMADARSIRRRVDRAAAKTALRAVRQQGCTCSPIITLTEWVAGAVPRYQVAHDDWCVLIRVDEGPAPVDDDPAIVFGFDPTIARMQAQLLKGEAA